MERVVLRGGDPNRQHILVLDGGGVRGLSSLLILEKLLDLVAEHVRRHYGADSPTPLLPHEIFDLVVGTSTGGLIALMIGKLGMSIGDCIDAYANFSEAIFSDGWHLRGWVSGGNWVPRYSEEVLCNKIAAVFIERERNANELMTVSKLLQKNHPTDEAKRDFAHSAVCCNRVKKTPNGHRMAPTQIFLCSHPCKSIKCTIMQAARATSAAPTYFKKLRINKNTLEDTDGQRAGTGEESRRSTPQRKKYQREEITLFDGGMQCNNPSLRAWHHYRRERHSEISWTGSRLVSLGTGLYDGITFHPPKRTIWQEWIHVPSALKLMKDAVTDPQQAAEVMSVLATTDRMEYHRFSATTGVCWIKLDDYKRLPEIRTSTEKYLEIPSVMGMINKCAKGMARDYVMKSKLANGNGSANECIQVGL